MGGNAMSSKAANSRQADHMDESKSDSQPPQPPIIRNSADLIQHRLSDRDRSVFQFTPMLAGLGAGMVGLLMNSYYRRALHITKARLASGLPMFFIPLVSVTAVWTALVTEEILSVNLRCESCVPIRGAAIGVVFGTLYPVILSIPINMSLAERYQSVQLPRFNQMPRYWWKVTFPMRQRLLAIAMYQAVIYGFCAYNQYSLFLKAFKEPVEPVGNEATEELLN